MMRIKKMGEVSYIGEGKGSMILENRVGIERLKADQRRLMRDLQRDQVVIMFKSI